MGRQALHRQTKPEELYANEFAGHLLMPINECKKRRKYHLIQNSQYFSVPSEIVKWWFEKNGFKVLI